MKRKICVFTGTRAEYALLRPLVRAVRDEPSLQLQLLVTGTHLSAAHGLTYHEIEGDGFSIDEKVEIALSDNSAAGVSKSVGQAMNGLTDALSRLKPDIIVILGDRFEALAAASTALFLGTPIAHIHGGEVTEGAFDEAIRHSITKMSSFHFVAAESYRRRVIQLGEQPTSVFLAGSLGVDAIIQTPWLGRQQLEEALDFRLGERNLLITFHPATREATSPAAQMTEVLAALKNLSGTKMIFTMPNADTGAQDIADMVTKFASVHPDARAYTSLGSTRYLSLLALVDGIIGNSSSGLIEAPALKVGTVNIGDRQRGRLRASSVIDCAPDRTAIQSALDKLFSPAFRAELARGINNPYGQGGATAKILAKLRDLPLENALQKSFFDLPLSAFDGIAP